MTKTDGTTFSDGTTTRTYNYAGGTNTWGYSWVKADDYSFRIISQKSAYTVSGMFLSVKVVIPEDMYLLDDVEGGLCMGVSGAAATNQGFVNTNFDSAGLAAILAANSWNSDGTAKPGVNSASCFANPEASRRFDGFARFEDEEDADPESSRRSTAAAQASCTSNEIDIDEATLQCVSTMQGQGASGMLDSCEEDYCAMGDSVLSAYANTALAEAKLDAAAMGEVTGDEEVTGASSDSSGGSDSNVGIIAGAAVGGVVLIVGIGIAVWWFNRGESTSADPKATTGVDPPGVEKSDPQPSVVEMKSEDVVEMGSDFQPLSVETTTTDGHGKLGVEQTEV